jgi:four helix bundle protein
MSNDQSIPNSINPKQNYDLEERTEKFAQNIIIFLRKIPDTTIIKPLKSQLIRSGTSIGANYCEADEANSKKDFVNKIAIAKKETKETKYWIKLISFTVPDFKEEAKVLWQEAQELNLIFAAIIRKSLKKD